MPRRVQIFHKVVFLIKALVGTTVAGFSQDSIRTADLLFLTPEKQFQYYQSADKLLPTNKIEAANNKYPLAQSVRDLSKFSFSYKDTLRTIKDFINATRVVGLIVVKNDTILYEYYRDGINRQTKWINFSVAKSVTSLLYGVALLDGYIKSLDSKVTDYITELKGSVYDSVSLQNLLQMSSGVGWNDDPRSGESDLMKVGRLEGTGGWTSVVDYLMKLKRVALPGQKFNYNTIETALAGIILKRTTGKSLASYLSERVWKPFGMHADANWVKSRSSDTENGGCCISATLRDYALLGIFAMKNGRSLSGTQLLPPNWMKESTTSSKSYDGYGYYWWLHSNHRFFASGSFGQQIEVDPSQNTVIAIQSYWPTAFSGYYVGYLDAFVDGMMNYFKEKK